MADRTVEDRLREEYFKLLPEIRKVTEYLEAVARYQLLALSGGLQEFEQISITSRVKDCESAVAKLRRQQEAAVFDPEKEAVYTLASLRDLAGIRILAFPSARVDQIDLILRESFQGWAADPVMDGQEMLALKYSGRCDASDRIIGEYQIVPMLTGLFWEIEHSAIYKPSSRLRSAEISLEMREPASAVYAALRGFEQQFETLIRRSQGD
jgi:hypothetical protein